MQQSFAMERDPTPQPLEIHRTAAQKLLNSLANSGNELFASFSYERPGDILGMKSGGANVFAKSRNLTNALLHLRSHGAPYLRDLSLDSVRQLATDFLQIAWADVVEGSEFDPGTKPIGSCITPEALERVASKLSRSPLFEPVQHVMLFPLGSVFIRTQFNGESFSFAREFELHAHLAEIGALPPQLNPKRFPPFEDPLIKSSRVFYWLRVSAPHPLIARKRAAAIMAALSLSTTRRARYSFGSQAPQLGHCRVQSDQVSVTPYAAPLTPPLSNDLLISESDLPSLAILDKHLTEPESRALIGALEYFHRAWFGEPRERFPLLCMALDALVCVESGHTSAAVKYVMDTLDTPINQARITTLMNLRGAVIHGAAPDVYESRFYSSYYSSYNEDPISDLELVVAACLRKAVFGGALAVRDPHASLILHHQNQGNLPKNLEMDAIIYDS